MGGEGREGHAASSGPPNSGMGGDLKRSSQSYSSDVLYAASAALWPVEGGQQRKHSAKEKYTASKKKAKCTVQHPDCPRPQGVQRMSGFTGTAPGDSMNEIPLRGFLNGAVLQQHIVK